MVETTDQYHRIPVAKKKKDAKIRTISISKGIKALYDAKNKIIVTYLFSVKQYSMKEAKAWVKSHKESKAHLVIAENYSLIEDIEKDSEFKRKQVIDKVVKLMESHKES
jgi:hypothetical protein